MALTRKDKIRKSLNLLTGIIGLAAFILLIADIGFYLTPVHIELSVLVIDIVIIIFIIQEAIRWIFIQTNPQKHIKKRWLENLIAVLLILHLIFSTTVPDLFQMIFPFLTIKQISIAYLAVIEIIILTTLIIQTLRYNYLITRINLHPGAILAFSFLIIILVGTLLLLLPKATPGAGGLRFIDALFTSTSAVCVTGLIVVDTETAFTQFGQFIILLLIQIGGLGIMTLTTFFTAFLASGMSFRIRVLMKELLSQESIAEVSKLLLRITITTFIIEIAGAAALYLSLGGRFSDMDYNNLFTSIFHSVSAFCNAGFSVFSDSMMQSAVAGNYLFITVVMILIVFGGIGFPVLSNFMKIRIHRKAKKKLRYQLSLTTKIVLASTALLLVSGTILFFAAEDFSFAKDMTFWEKLYHSLFLSVTARTAGFNTLPTGALAMPVVLILLLFMWIGASPGSTGGGIKTTTFSLTVLSLFDQIRGKERIELFSREIDSGSLKRSYLVIISSLLVLCIGTIILVWIEPDKDPMDLIFEATSAISTVGLSRGITFNLGDGGKIVITLLMFIGRIGVLTFFLSFYNPKRQLDINLPKRGVMVG